MLVAFAIAALMDRFAWSSSNQAALRAYGARLVSQQDAPQLHEIVDRLRQRAGLPMPRIAIAPHPQPNAFATGRNERNAVVTQTWRMAQALAPFVTEATMRKGILLVLLALGATVPAAQAATSPSTEQAAPRGLTIANKPWTGDFDKMLERRMIRIYAPFSRSLYLNDKGRERGIAVELARDWERYLNVKYAKQLGKRPLTVYIAPATRDKLLPDLNEGLGRLDRQPHGHRRAAEARRFRAGRRGTAHDQ